MKLKRLVSRWRYMAWELWYALLCRVWHRYNRLHVKTLPVTWSDRCDLLPHAMFQILEDFVERERSTYGGGDEQFQGARQKMIGLLNWWHQIYLPFDSCAGIDRSKCTPLTDRFDGWKAGEHFLNDYERKFYRKAYEKEQAIDRELTVKLKELIDLRKFLWT